MSDSERIEEGHVMKEPEVKDLKNNKNITKKWVSSKNGKEIGVSTK